MARDIRSQIPITQMDLAFCLLLDAGATAAEAWDYSPRVVSDHKPLWARSVADLRLDLAMWRRFMGKLCG